MNLKNPHHWSIWSWGSKKSHLHIQRHHRRVQLDGTHHYHYFITICYVNYPVLFHNNYYFVLPLTYNHKEKIILTKRYKVLIYWDFYIQNIRALTSIYSMCKTFKLWSDNITYELLLVKQPVNYGVQHAGQCWWKKDKLTVNTVSIEIFCTSMWEPTILQI